MATAPQKNLENVSLMTEEQFRQALPKSVRNSVSSNVLQYVNDIIVSDPETNENLRTDVLTYAGVMQEGRFKIIEYINAVRYVSFKLGGDTNIAAYTRTFPDRFQAMKDKGICDRDISSIITKYKNTKIVNLIFAKSLIPTHILNHDIYQEAINVQASLMRNARSETVRMKAADSILNQLKAPEVQKIELDVGYKDDPAIEELKNTTAELVRLQKLSIVSGSHSVKEIAHSRIMGGNVEDAEIIEEEGGTLN